jgi:tRNA threonylcarbamoyl adenosine modification protein YeaZ
MRLILDTSTSIVSMGLHDGTNWLGHKYHGDGKNQQSKVLFKVLEKFMNECGISKKQITEVAIGKGPGSYTGLRIGMTLAKVWSFAQKIDLYTFSSGDLLEKTKSKDPAAEWPKVEYLESVDFEKVSDINKIEPIYQNDHFA